MNSDANSEGFLLFHSFRFGALREATWVILLLSCLFSPIWFAVLWYAWCMNPVWLGWRTPSVSLWGEGRDEFIDRISAECSIWCVCQWISAPHKERKKKEWGAIWARVPNSFFRLTGRWYPSPGTPRCFTWRLIESGRARCPVPPFPACFNISWLPFYIGVGNQEVRRSVSGEARLHHWTWQSRTTDKPWVW